jgi:AcrR family transcriptional regulator
MAPRQVDSDDASTIRAADVRSDGAADSVVRRTPFSSNPQVGARGQRTQQRILDAALQLFGEEGYHRCSIDRITDRAGCSRASFYQYFSSKAEVFQQLTGQVARQLSASTEALDPLTPDAAGWLALRAWVARHAEIYRRYEPAFHEFGAASENDEAVATGSARWQERNIARFHSRLATTDLPPRQLDPVILLLLESMTRTHDMAGILRSAVPDGYPDERVIDALTDVIHRSLFGLDPEVNVHPPADVRPPVLRFDPVFREAFRRGGPDGELTASGRQTRDALMEAGRETFVRLGYHRTRVDDVVEAAGVSHGAFYRYFGNKDHMARILTAQAMQTVSVVLSEIPTDDAHEGPAGRTALRRWLRRYNATQSNEAAMLRVWVDAELQDATARSNSAPALDWGRRKMAAFLRPRDFGDVDTEAMVLVAVLSAFGSRSRPPAAIDAAAHIVQQGFLGR